MKLTRLFSNDKLSLSFEVFPPKTDTAFESVKHATEEIAKLHPSFMSVTYGAGGGTSRYTLDIAKNIKARYGVPTLAHLTCVSSTKETVISCCISTDSDITCNLFFVFAGRPQIIIPLSGQITDFFTKRKL